MSSGQWGMSICMSAIPIAGPYCSGPTERTAFAAYSGGTAVRSSARRQ